MKTLFAVSCAVVAALVLALSPAPASANGFRGHTPRASVFPKPVDPWKSWGRPAHSHFHQPHFTVPHFTVPHFTVVVPQTPVFVAPRPVFVAPRRVFVPGFWSWTGFYWVWVPAHWR
jgi:hypothetical protein